MKRFCAGPIRVYRFGVILFTLPFLLAGLFQRRTGSEYGVGFFTKMALVVKIYRNNKRIPSVSNYLEHYAMATKILAMPKSSEGCIVECGSYKGGSTANLSLLSALCQRQLEVFDSFAGLPQPSAPDKAHAILDTGEIHTYAEGAWRGSLEEVTRNVSRYGNLNACNFNVGYFDQTLPGFKKHVVFIFLDVDLRDSLETCLKYLWPLLRDGGYLFTHEAPHLEISSLFFDKDWWHQNLNCEPPGLIGAGSGLGLVPESGAFRSAIGYTVKNPGVDSFVEVPQTG